MEVSGILWMALLCATNLGTLKETSQKNEFEVKKVLKYMQKWCMHMQGIGLQCHARHLYICLSMLCCAYFKYLVLFNCFL